MRGCEWSGRGGTGESGDYNAGDEVWGNGNAVRLCRSRISIAIISFLLLPQRAVENQCLLDELLKICPQICLQFRCHDDKASRSELVLLTYTMLHVHRPVLLCLSSFRTDLASLGCPTSTMHTRL